MDSQGRDGLRICSLFYLKFKIRIVIDSLKIQFTFYFELKNFSSSNFFI